MGEEVRIIEVSGDEIIVEVIEEVITVEAGETAVTPVWGTIGGDLSDQTDLAKALRDKADADHNHDDRYYTETETDSLLSGKADVIITETEGDPAIFPDGTDAPAEGVTAAIEGTQSGSGTPSPSNVRPLTGRTGITLSVNGETVTISFGDAETVYSGSLDVLTGELTVNVVLRTFTEVISFNTTTYISRIAEDGKPWSANVFYNYLKTVSGTTPGAGEGTRPSSSGRLLIKLPGITTEEACNAYLAANPLQVAYELAAPLTYQLEGQEIRTILGNNTIGSDTGAVKVRYRADTKGYIDKLIAELQALILEN